MKKGTLKLKMTGGIIALLLVGITVPTTHAQTPTLAELQAQINSLLIQIAALQSGLPVTTSQPAVCTTAKNDLTIGRSGPEVRDLQTFLISRGFSIRAGATGYFGNQTQQALARFQGQQGIMPAIGYYGPLTRARIQSICSTIATPTTPTTPTPTTPPEETLSGEASLERFSVNDGDDTDLEEGDRNVSIMDVSFEVADGDVKINRIDIGVTPDSANDENDPWDTFSTISVYQGSKLIGQADGSKRQNWREDSPNNGDYLLRISGINWIVKENRDVDLVVKASVQNSVRGTTDGELWNVFIPDNGIRGLDADNAVVYAGDTADAVSINIDQAGSSDELLVRRSDEDPDSSSLQLKDNNRSGFIPVFAFDLDTDDSRNDIEIRRLPITLTLGNSSAVDSLVRSARLVVDGTTYTDYTVSGDTLVFTFRRDDLAIRNGDRVTAMLELDFRALAPANEGLTIVGSIDASDIEAEGADDLTGNQLAGAATGELHTLYTKGTEVGSPSFTAVVTTSNGDLNDYVTFNGEITMTAFGQDAYIPTDGSSVVYQLTDAIGNGLAASGTAVVSSSADESGNYFVIREGSSETLSLTVTYVPGVANTAARMQLVSIGFSDTAQAPDQTWYALPASNYRTPTRIIVN